MEWRRQHGLGFSGDTFFMMIKTIGILAHAGKEAALAAARVAEDYLCECGIEVRLPEQSARSCDRSETVAEVQSPANVSTGTERAKSVNRHPCDERVASSDAVLVLGGDGTILAASRQCAPFGTPILPVHLGRFGFLTEVPPDKLRLAIDRLLAGDYTIDERMMVTGSSTSRGGQPTAKVYALNEIVVANGPLSRVLHLRLSINGRYVTTYAADGIIVATPTGSTAYSLSAGGPLVHPALQTLLITPICPHTLTARALLVPPHHEIVIELENDIDDNVRVTVDGQLGFPISPGDRVAIGASPYPAQMISVGGPDFYDKLQTKLRWGDRVVY